LHDHRLGGRIAGSGCQKVAVIDGRSYRRLGVQLHTTSEGRSTLEYTLGSAGGHVTTAPNPGNIQHPATFEAFSLNPETLALHVSLFTVKPDGSVRVTPPAPIP